jgi:hypothetical protein
VVSFCVCCSESAFAPESLCASTSRCKLAIIEHTALATDLVPSVDHDDTHFVFACSRVFAAVTGTLSERGFNGLAAGPIAESELLAVYDWMESPSVLAVALPLPPEPCLTHPGVC